MISSETSTATGTLSGATGTIVVGFYFFANTDLVVTRTRSGVVTTLTLDSDYTVTGAGNESGGSVAVVGQASGDVITIERTIDYKQISDYIPLTKLSATTIERDFDRCAMRDQQIVRRVKSLEDNPSTGIEEAPLDGTPYARQDAEWIPLAGGGDMLKSVYDTDNDGKVDSAETADTATTAGTLSGNIPISQVVDLTSALASKQDASTALSLGETSATAYRGDRGKTAYDHSQITTGNPHGTTKTDLSLGNVDNTSDANKPISTATATALSAKANTADLGTAAFTASTAYATAAQGATADAAASGLSSHVGNTANPHGTTAAQTGAVPTSRTVNGHALTGDVIVTKSDVGLSNVDNTADVNKPVSTAQATAIAAQTFSAVALTNPYAASPALTPRYIGDSAVNLTSLEVWQATATAASASSWNNISRGFYNGAIITDFNSPVASDCYTAYGTATNAPTSSESFFLHHINSNAGNVSAFQVAIGYTTGKIYTRQKIASTWGSWSVGITQTELGYLAGAIQPIQAQITNLNFFNLMLDNGRWLGSAGQNLDSKVTPSVTYTASTISFSASVGTISSSVAGFSGFVAGMCVVITGSTSNNLMVTVTSADASTITCEFQGGQAFVNESAGASITLKGYAITASTWLSPYQGSTNFKLVGMNIYDNSNAGGTRGYLNEAVTSLHTAMYGYIARYSVESGIAQTTAAVANSNFFVNNGKAFFTHNASGTFGAWIRFIGGTGTMLYDRDYSIGSSAWVNGKATFNSGTWYQFKTQLTGIKQGYSNGFPDLSVDTVGAKMQIFAPFFISGLIPSNFTWTGPIFNSTPVQ